MSWIGQKIGERSAMTVLRREHDQWLATAELGVPYYAEDSYFEWQEGTGPAPALACYHRVIFDKRGRDRLYSGSSSSWDLWFDWGPLTTQAPKMPGRPTMPYITGDIADWEHPERWQIKTVTR